jgi:hypothetical protein
VSAVVDGLTVRMRTRRGGTGRYRHGLFWQAFFRDPRAQRLADASESIAVRVRVSAFNASVRAGTRIVLVSPGYG